MPELHLFKRRWHTATDALPLMMALLFLFHLLWFIPYATGAWSVEGTGLQYECVHATELRVASYSLLALFGLAAINEVLLTVLGLRGGPFETRKRRAMKPLLYLEVMLWLLLLAFTVYATVIVYSPKVNNACWSNNPCQYNPDIFPLACRDKSGDGIRELSPSCKALLEAGPRFLNCWTDWIASGLNWVTDTVQLFNTWGATLLIDSYTKLLAEKVGNATAIPDSPPPPTLNDGIDYEVYEEAEHIATCTAYNFLCCYLIKINRHDLADALREENMAEDRPCDWDLFENPTVTCNAPSAPWDKEQLEAFGQCNATIDNVYWGQELNITIELGDGDVSDESTGNIIIGGSDSVQDYNAFLREHPDLFQYINYELLAAINESTLLDLTSGVGNNLTTAASMPWFDCLTSECQSQTRLADECTQWAQILSLPNPKNRKKFFEILVITSWTVLGITALVVFVCFNAFPDYNDVDSWEGTVRSINRLCLCGGGLAGSATVSGSDMSVSHEIAKSLNLLFGGADMDPTDRLLGIYLVSERQHRRRQQDVLTALQKAGFAMQQRHSSKMQQVLSRFTPKRWRSGQTSLSPPTGIGGRPNTSSAVSGSQRAVANGAAQRGMAGALAADRLEPVASPDSGSIKRESLDKEDEAPQAVPLAGGVAAAANGSSVVLAGSPAATAPVQVAAGQLPLSPFDVPVAASQVGQRSPSGSAAPGDSRLMMYQHSMIRLRSSLEYKGSRGDSIGRSLAKVEEGKGRTGDSSASGSASDDMAADEVEPEHVLEEPTSDMKGFSSSQDQGSLHAGGTQQTSDSWQNAAIRVASRYHPLLTPSGCAGADELLQPPISPRAAANIYAGKLDPVDQGTLREAQRISRFAVAAYGLQGVIWAQGKRPRMCLANANRLVKCFKKPFGLENKFRKRNFDAIIQMTGLQPADLLYVSYTNVAGGVLPYLIMLHRPSKSVVLSVRGTVSMEDLITDLLSNPVDVTDWVPEWVREEAQRRKAAGIAGDASGDSLKAHIGIVSSATAILQDMEERGLLREMLLSKLIRAATAMGRDTQEVIAEYLQTHSGEFPELVPQQEMDGKGHLGGDPLAAAAAGKGLHGISSWLLGSLPGGRKDGKDQAQFVQSEQRHLSRIQSLREEVEVRLPLERAQTIIRSKLQLQGWKMVVTGHSLGAAVACLLGMQLRERFADLQCWAFNPPGGLVSWELAKIAERYCTSIVVGKDVISRLSFNTSKRVVDEMVVSLARCKRPKLKVMCDVVLGRRKRPETTPRTFCKFEEMAPEALQLVEQYYRASQLHMKSADTTEMYPPGKLVFMRPFKGKRKQQTVWDAVWIDAATLISEGILVTPSMMAHHRLFVLAEAFESIFAGEAATEAAAQDEQGEEDVVDFMHL